jgi:hypothetical protein
MYHRARTDTGEVNYALENGVVRHLNTSGLIIRTIEGKGRGVFGWSHNFEIDMFSLMFLPHILLEA